MFFSLQVRPQLALGKGICKGPVNRLLAPISELALSCYFHAAVGDLRTEMFVLEWAILWTVSLTLSKREKYAWPIMGLHLCNTIEICIW